VSNNAAERALRGIAVGRNNWTFAGSDEGGERTAAIYTLIETAKLNDVDPQAWLADVLARLPDHPAKRIADLLPWNWKRDHQERPSRSRPVHIACRDINGHIRGLRRMRTPREDGRTSLPSCRPGRAKPRRNDAVASPLVFGGLP
jgi:hypothetical protein